MSPDMFAIVEIMGRRTRAGRISEAQLGGATMLRIEHPTAADHTGDEPLTEYYAPAAVFAIRPCSLEQAQAVAGWAWPQAATPELGPSLPAELAELVDDDHYDYDGDPDDAHHADDVPPWPDDEGEGAGF